MKKRAACRAHRVFLLDRYRSEEKQEAEGQEEGTEREEEKGKSDALRRGFCGDEPA